MPQPFGKHSRLHLETLEDRLVPSTVAGSFIDGTWRYDTTTGWAHISDLKAERIDVDDAGNVYASYFYNATSDGLWRWSAATASWSKPSNLRANTFEVTAGGVLYGDFGSQGVWRLDSYGWMKLSNLDPSLIAVSDSDTFFGTFNTGLAGTWRWVPTAGWSLLSSGLPSQLQTDSAGHCVGIFNTTEQFGTWRWTSGSGWACLSTKLAPAIDVSANGAIYENRDTGLWRAAPGAASFTQIDSANYNNAILQALPDGSLYVERFDVATYGWYWSPSLPGLGVVKLFRSSSFTSPPAVGKDGDLFFGDSESTMGTWSPTSPYHLVGGPGGYPDYLASQRGAYP
jgi:hypothetical protein